LPHEEDSVNDEWTQKTVWLIAVLAALLLAVATLVAAVNLGENLAAKWVVVVFQILMTIAMAVIIGVAVVWLVTKPLESVTASAKQLEVAHGALLARLHRREPTLVAMTVLIAEATILIADKSFQGEPLPTVMVSIALLFFLDRRCQRRRPNQWWCRRQILRSTPGRLAGLARAS
jgi:hypothetical protein